MRTHAIRMRFEAGAARGLPLGALALVVAMTLASSASTASTARARTDRPGDRDAAGARPSLQEVSHAFESARLLAGAERAAALDQVDAGVAGLLHRGVDADQRTALQFLSGTVAYERGRFDAAEDAFRRAQGGNERGRFGDDAAFAAIQALEAQGRDADAAREWVSWEKRFPSSPLGGEARLAQAWNALRRGAPEEAEKSLATLAARAPWMAGDARVSLARAATLYVEGRPAEALSALGPRPTDAPSKFLAALCLGATGSLLRSAAGFQDVADRFPDSPLRDASLFAKANAFLTARDYRSAATEFARTAARVDDAGIRGESELRSAGAVFLTGATDSALALFHGLAQRYAGGDVAARAQFLIGEALVTQGKPDQAIVEYNRVLTSYFRHSVAASAQYRVARCLDAMGRHADATGSYEAVVRGYPLEPEAPAAAYLAGLGQLAQERPLAAAPYFQLVLDRYASRSDAKGFVVFASPEHQELVEAALCMLEYAYHRSGNLGQLSGAPHLLLQHLPPSHSTWRAYATLIDADASAAQARYPEAQAALEDLARDFRDQPVGPAAMKLLAWTYSKQGRDSLAIATEELLLARNGAGDDALVAGALLDIAHERFNQKRYAEAAAGYEDFLRRYPAHPRHLLALYQAGLCYLRLNRAGDAVDRWQAIVRDSAGAPIAERAWARAGDLYFQAERYDRARTCYAGLLEHFPGSGAASLAMLRLAQCEYNAGHDAASLEQFAGTIDRFPGTPAAREAQHGTELALYRLSQSANGDKELARLVEQFPGSPFAADAQFKLARRAYDQKRWTEAADGFRKVVSQFPSYSAADQAQFLLAECLGQAKQGEEARLAYEQFLAYFPQSELRPTVQFRLGLMQFEAKSYAPAAVAFTQVLADSASGEVASAARYNLALCHRMLGDAEEARAELLRYRAAYPGDARAADVACQLGDLDEAAGRADDAAREYDEALASRPSAALATELHFRLGRCLEQRGAKARALFEYQQAAAARDRDDAFRLSAVARCAALYEARKDFAHAVEAYRDLIRNASDRELVAAATDRVSQLEAATRRR